MLTKKTHTDKDSTSHAPSASVRTDAQRTRTQRYMFFDTCDLKSYHQKSIHRSRAPHNRGSNSLSRPVWPRPNPQKSTARPRLLSDDDVYHPPPPRGDDDGFTQVDSKFSPPPDSCRVQIVNQIVTPAVVVTWSSFAQRPAPPSM